MVVGAVLEPTSLDIVTPPGRRSTRSCSTTSTRRCSPPTTTVTIEPGLAELPEVSDDGTVYTFTLQDGVTFHSGEPLTSADVVWSLDAQRGRGRQRGRAISARSPSSRRPTTSPSSSRSTQPDNDFAVSPDPARRRRAAGRRHRPREHAPTAPVRSRSRSGTSARRSRSPATTTTGARRRRSAGVTFLYFTDPNAAVNAFTTGDVDILTGVNSDLVGPLQENPDYVVNEGTTNGEFTLGFNNAREPFTDRDVRTGDPPGDRQGGRTRSCYNGFGTIIGGPVPPTDPWYEDLTDVAPYDPDAARQLLAEAPATATGSTSRCVYPNIYPTTNGRVRRLAARRGRHQRRRSRPSSSRCGSSRCTPTTTTT